MPRRPRNRAHATGRDSHNDLRARNAVNLRGRTRDRYQQPWSGGQDRRYDRGWRRSGWYADGQDNWHTGKRKDRSKSDKTGRMPHQLPKTRHDQWRSKSPEYENLRENKLDALLQNTADSGKWCIDLDRYVEHDPRELKGFSRNSKNKRAMRMHSYVT